MNDQEICELIAKRVDTRAVQIADHFDKELRDVSEALRALVDCGDVLRTPGIGPNGQPAQFYNLSDAYRKSKEGREIMGKVAGQIDATVTVAIATPALPVRDLSKAVQQPIEPPRGEAVLSRVDRAIQHLAAAGSASDVEMRLAMGLAAPASPMAYLAHAVKAGRLSKLDGVWRLGQWGKAVSPKPVALAEALSSVAQHGGSIVTTTQVEPAASEAATTTVFRCGLWSDGVLELQRNGVAVAFLERGEGEHLADFVNRMLRNPMSV